MTRDEFRDHCRDVVTEVMTDMYGGVPVDLTEAFERIADRHEDEVRTRLIDSFLIKSAEARAW